MTALRALACAAAVLALAGPALAQKNPTVSAPSGALQGRLDGDIRAFKGIPYAEAPVGQLRWAPPKPAPAWSGVRDADKFGPACMQPTPAAPSIYSDGAPPMSEDCLSLNVWAPENARKAPVLVWIHGGSLNTGSSSERMYDGVKLARRGVVVVSINYRLGVLGYMAHPELSKESPRGVSGNYGLLDQVEALRWVQKNIAAFGGDPANVTIAGESAGGLSVMYLLASPDARGLFAKAIAQSAYMISTPSLKEARFGEIPAETIGATVQSKLKAADLAALRAMPAKALLTQAAAAGYAPFGTIDGKVLPRQIAETFDRGEQAKVPLMAGFNSGEIRSLRFLAPPIPAGAAAYETTIRERYQELAPEFLRLYPSAPSLEQSILASTRDGIYGWTAQRLAVKQTAAGQPAYLYIFDHGYPAADSAGLHAHHASELPYMFGNAGRLPELWPKPPVSPAETKLSDTMMSYWTSFARTGAPTAPGAPAWPAYGSQEGYILFQDVPKAGQHPMPGMYRLHEQVVCRRRAVGGIAWNWNLGLVSPPLPPPAASCR